MHATMTEDLKSQDERLQWLREARFGIFVHWGMYAVLGRGEQILFRDRMPFEAYARLADRFRPEPFAEDWARQAAGAGAQYMVLTTRHHDGFCLFDTKTTDFNAARTGAGRDLIAEYVEGCRGQGLKVGFYYSLVNWHKPATWSPERYPEQVAALVEEVHTQIRELMTNYGTIDVLWFDGGWVPTRRDGTFVTEAQEKAAAVAEFWRAEELHAMARELQPDLLINNRAGIPGDYGTPEQVVKAEGAGRAWETCMTLNYAPGWGYQKYSSANKTPAEVLYNLLDAVRLGGNFLFNVGPRPDGRIDEREASVLRALAPWFQRHGEAVHGTAPAGIYGLSGREQGPCFHHGMWTCKGSTAYLSVFRWPGRELILSQIATPVRSATLLTTGEPLEVEAISNGRTLIAGLPESPPDPLAPVLKVEFEAPPRRGERSPGADPADWLGGLTIDD
ncbi:MAG: alpha-L-fucosidase [Kiritimatiellae bacterium]|nr:alpha-L-fucosidase [Kiritimatiellia bacterium]